MERIRTHFRFGSRSRSISSLAVSAALMALPVANAAIHFDLDAASPSGGTDTNAHSASVPFTSASPAAFSVDRVAIGRLGSGVAQQAAVGSEEAHGDVFFSGGGGNNTQFIDEQALSLIPGFFGDDLDALELHTLTTFLYLSIDFLSASNSFGADTLANDIFLNSIATAFASGETDIGLAPSDNIDALSIYDGGVEGVLNPGLDYAVFSLDSFSPTITGGSFNPGDLLYTEFDGTFSLWRDAASLGLRADDELNALSIPEPGSFALLLVAGATLLRRRRTQA